MLAIQHSDMGPMTEVVDVPEPTSNGRLSPDEIVRIRASCATLSLRLVVVLGGWIFYLLAVSSAVAWGHAAAWIAVPTVGVWLFTWLGYYRHELWHNYFPGIHNPTWFDLVSYLLFSDPQIYRIAHPAHHKFVHSLEDIEFFCEKHQTDQGARRRQYVLELLFGNMAWELSTLYRLLRQGRATKWASRMALLKRLMLTGGLAVIAAQLAPAGHRTFLAVYLSTLWLGSLMTRHNQWLEHLGLESTGDLAERNMLTRNLRSDTFPAWLFNVMNHNDANEHVLHHTEPHYNSRGVSGLRLPAEAQVTTLGEHFRRVLTHYQTL